MATTLATFDPSASSGSTFDSGLGKDPGTIIGLNDSNYSIILTIPSTGDKYRWVPGAWRLLKVPPGNPAIAWAQEMNLALANPVSVVWMESYKESEQIPETYPVALVRAVAGAFVNANTLTNNNSPAATTVINTTSTITHSGGNTEYNDGSRTTTLRSLGGGPLTFESLVADSSPTGINKAAAAYGYSGDPTLTKLFALLTDTFSSGAGTVYPVQMTESTSGKTWELGVDSSGNLLLFNSTDSTTLKLASGAAPLLTLPGGLSVFASQITRPAGVHQTGYAGGGGKAVTASDIWYFPIQYPMAGTNVATGATLTVATSTNCSAAVAASSINKDGFLLQLTATAAGAFQWIGTYTTSGD